VKGWTHKCQATLNLPARKHIAAILRVRAPVLSAEAARDVAVVLVQLITAANMLSDEEGVPGRAAALRALRALAAQYLEQHLHRSPA
jgi:hypothetical protein